MSIDRANVCYFNYYTTQHLLDNFYQFSSSSCLINLLVENRIYKGKFAITYPLQTSKFFTNKTLLCTMLSIFILIFLFIYFFNKGISYGLERKMRKIRKIVINVAKHWLILMGRESTCSSGSLQIIAVMSHCSIESDRWHCTSMAVRQFAATIIPFAQYNDTVIVIIELDSRYW